MTKGREVANKWHLTMQALQTLTVILKEDMGNLNQLLQGMVITAFHNPLLRTVTIDGISYIAHTTAGFGALRVRGTGNPLEDTSSTGDRRVRLYGNQGILSIEENVGPRYKDHIAQSIDDACERACSKMARCEDFTGTAAQTFSTLLHLTLHDRGSAFKWTAVDNHRLTEFRTIEIIYKATETQGNLPPYNLILSS